MSNPSADASPKCSELIMSFGSKDAGQCALPPHPYLYFLSLSCSKMCPVLVWNKMKHTWIVNFCLTLRVPFDSGLMVWDCCHCNPNWETSRVDVVNTKLRRSGVQQRPRAVSGITFLRVCFRNSSQDGSIKNEFCSQVGYIPHPMNEHPNPTPKIQTITTWLDISPNQLPLEVNFMRYLLTSCGTSLWEILLR